MKIQNRQWATLLEDEFEKAYYKKMWSILEDAYNHETIYPPKSQVFSAFETTDYDQVKVVILGQDPYHGQGQAHGLCFSVMPDKKLPPSLKNIYKELALDLGIPIPDHGYLIDWAKQGILMINAICTVRAGVPSSHKYLGWESFTDRVIELLNERDEGMVFVLWGNYAIKKEALITNPRHRVVKSPHPSPFSARTGFFGSRPFSSINNHLMEMGYTAVDWTIKPYAQQMKLDL
ncbi:MAG: uracil-DNA glycosylase [Firmicutes bacterium HGW-Firmicutes-3]|jgi:uracil-DNA glycosylase|nr:MAG: uracil-DNA glycosylase [Firmicutes bacterium HGW-Firmicutes-3]